MTKSFVSRRGAARWGFLLSLGSACAMEPAEFNARVAAADCDFSAKCTPQLWELRCQACRSHEDCPLGACDIKSGRCRDARGRTSGNGLLFATCAYAQDCGDYLCKKGWENQHACEAETVKPLEKAREMCSFDDDAARECERLLQERGCQSLRPPICDFVYDTCMK